MNHTLAADAPSGLCKYLVLEEVAELFRVKPQTIIAWTKKKLWFPRPIRPDKKLLFREDQIRDVLARLEGEAQAAVE